MSYKRTIVCLANSTKHYPSRCIAGKEWGATGPGRWLRPVTDYKVDEGAIPLLSSRLQDRSQPQLLDVIQIPLGRAVPHGCQLENHLITDDPWLKQGRLNWANLEAMVENHPDLWGSGNSSVDGLNDRLSLQDGARQPDSLRLVRPNNLRIVVSKTSFGKKGMRALFDIGKTSYSLKVTDPRYTGRINQHELDVEYPIQGAILCVSIGEPWNGYYYKLLATIFSQQDF